jgi:hypothetical protein
LPLLSILIHFCGQLLTHSFDTLKNTAFKDVALRDAGFFGRFLQEID